MSMTILEYIKQLSSAATSYQASDFSTADFIEFDTEAKYTNLKTLNNLDIEELVAMKRDIKHLTKLANSGLGQAYVYISDLATYVSKAITTVQQLPYSGKPCRYYDDSSSIDAVMNMKSSISEFSKFLQDVDCSDESIDDAIGHISRVIHDCEITLNSAERAMKPMVEYISAQIQSY